MLVAAAEVDIELVERVVLAAQAAAATQDHHPIQMDLLVALILVAAVVVPLGTIMLAIRIVQAATAVQVSLF